VPVLIKIQYLGRSLIDMIIYLHKGFTPL